MGTSEVCYSEIMNAGDRRKLLKISSEIRSDNFDSLPDDLVLSILSKLSSTAGCPADFINVLTTCKRLNGLGLNPVVLHCASEKALAVKARNWSKYPHRFLKFCADAGNVEAYFILGMIYFYCYRNRRTGVVLMAKAAIASHPPAWYSLAVLKFNWKDPIHGVWLCEQAASLGHVDALRELGHGLLGGYWAERNADEGRRYLNQAKARELEAVLAAANQFISDWFSGKELGSGLRLCSHPRCRRPEMRKFEFRRCSVCGDVSYCSLACQTLDWEVRHKVVCVRTDRGMA